MNHQINQHILFAMRYTPFEVLPLELQPNPDLLNNPAFTQWKYQQLFKNTNM